MNLSVDSLGARSPATPNKPTPLDPVPSVPTNTHHTTTHTHTHILQTNTQAAASMAKLVSLIYILAILPMGLLLSAVLQYVGL
jgi:hypothetical protein